VTCPACNQEVTAVRVGTGSYCQNCGARIEDTAAGRTSRPKAGATPRALDLRPRAASSSQSAPAAAALHGRTTPARRNVLDLRAADSTKAKATAKPPHWSEELPTSAAAVAHHTATPAAAPKATAKEVHFSRFTDRFKDAKGVPRSQHIARFDSHFKPHVSEGTVPAPAAEPAGPQLPAAVATQHEAMTRLTKPVVPARPVPSALPSRSGLSSRAGGYAATAAVVAIMGGYIWLQNYPKLAIQSASGKAGLSASLPGYVPSSYHLATTSTGPGLVTLSFTSPSATDALTIKQHRTTWDSSSLLDQYVAGKSAEYTAVEGQGLTVYLYAQNQATWVNHGVWYSIEGASRLSREQILKIAYSL
jgi:hypothetical protein